MCSKQRIYRFAFKRFRAQRQRTFWCIQLNFNWFSIVIKNVLFYFFCLHCCLINIHIFDYPDSWLSGLFTEVPTSPDNRGSTVLKTCKKIIFSKQADCSLTNSFSGPKSSRDFRETGPRGPFLESPKTLRSHFGWHDCLCIFKTKASRGTKLRSYFNFYSVYNIW